MIYSKNYNNHKNKESNLRKYKVIFAVLLIIIMLIGTVSISFGEAIKSKDNSKNKTLNSSTNNNKTKTDVKVIDSSNNGKTTDNKKGNNSQKYTRAKDNFSNENDYQNKYIKKEEKIKSKEKVDEGYKNKKVGKEAPSITKENSLEKNILTYSSNLQFSYDKNITLPKEPLPYSDKRGFPNDLDFLPTEWNYAKDKQSRLPVYNENGTNIESWAFCLQPSVGVPNYDPETMTGNPGYMLIDEAKFHTYDAAKRDDCNTFKEYLIKQAGFHNFVTGHGDRDFMYEYIRRAYYLYLADPFDFQKTYGRGIQNFKFVYWAIIAHEIDRVTEPNQSGEEADWGNISMNNLASAVAEVLRNDYMDKDIKYNYSHFKYPSSRVFPNDIATDFHLYKTNKNKYQNIMAMRVKVLTYNLKITKTDHWGNLLKGAKFELSKINDPSFRKRKIDLTNKAEIIIENLTNGGYKLTEIKAPDGYEKIKEPIIIKVGEGFDVPYLFNPKILTTEDLYFNETTSTLENSNGKTLMKKEGTKLPTIDPVKNGEFIKADFNIFFKKNPKAGDVFYLTYSNDMRIINQRYSDLVVDGDLVAKGILEPKKHRIKFIVSNYVKYNDIKNKKLNFKINFDIDRASFSGTSDTTLDFGIGSTYLMRVPVKVLFPNIIKEGSGRLEAGAIIQSVDVGNGYFYAGVILNPNELPLNNKLGYFYTALWIYGNIKEQDLSYYEVTNLGEFKKTYSSKYLRRIVNNKGKEITFSLVRHEDENRTDIYPFGTYYLNRKPLVVIVRYPLKKDQTKVSSRFRFGSGMNQNKGVEFSATSFVPNNNNNKPFVDPYPNIKVKNEKKKRIIITKRDEATKNILVGAKFKLMSEDGKKQIRGEKAVNSQGKLIFDNVEAGKYILVETVAPPGYKKSDTPIEVGVMHATLDKKIEGKNEVYSVSQINGKIETLYGNINTVIKDINLDKKTFMGEVYINIPKDKDGVKINNSMQLEAKLDWGEGTSVFFKNLYLKQGKKYISVKEFHDTNIKDFITDQLNSNLLNFYGYDGNIFVRRNPNNNKLIELNDLYLKLDIEGRYKDNIDFTTEFYDKNSDLRFTSGKQPMITNKTDIDASRGLDFKDKDGNNLVINTTETSITVYNKKNKNHIKFNKFGEDDKSLGGLVALEGVKFELRKKGDDGRFTKYREGFSIKGTDGNASIEFKNLPQGEYELWEVRQKDGTNYVLPKKAIRSFKVREDGVIEGLKVLDNYTYDNKKSKNDIINYFERTYPKTGGMGPTMYLIFGLMIMSVGAGLYIKNKKYDS